MGYKYTKADKILIAGVSIGLAGLGILMASTKHMIDQDAKRKVEAEELFFRPYGLADINKDGKVSLTERAAVYERLGKTNINWPALYTSDLDRLTQNNGNLTNSPPPADIYRDGKSTTNKNERTFFHN
ncbi:MAG: hypothetical protein Q7R87_03940 [Nanoarchaeota archaeon]|nr:hypothetical protein [Nanoarchaeota archaeon]